MIASMALGAGAGLRARAAPRWLRAFVLGATALVVQTAWPQGEGARAQTAARSELQWLQLIQDAARRLNYAGTIVFEQHGQMRASRIVHYYDGRISHERLYMLDGQPREFIRSGDEVRCLYPEARRVLIESHPGKDAFPGLGDAEPGQILLHYRVRIAALDRVAGLECRIVAIEPKDSLRYGYRLCIDSASGLLLKTQTVDARMAVLEQMAFSEVRIGRGVDEADLRPSWSIEGWQVDRSEHRQADLAAAGWTVVAPEGFVKIKEVSRRMGARQGSERDALQAVFSDGLATLSLFIEPRAGESPPDEFSHARGAVSVYVRTLGDVQITAVGEVPPATLRAVAQSVEARAPR